MRVAEIVDIGGGRIEKGSAQGIDPLDAADDGGLPAAGKFRKGGQRDLDRVGAAAGERYRKQIYEGALSLMAHVGGHILPPRRKYAKRACR